MDIVSSVAAVAGLLEQAIGLWKSIAQARRAVLGAPKAVADVEAQLSGLLGTVKEVSRQPVLHTPSVHSQLQAIHADTTELTTILGAMRVQLTRSAFRQGLHALMKKHSDDASLKNVLGRLNGAKMDLGLRVQVAQMDHAEVMGQGIVRIEEAVVEGGKVPNLRIEENEASHGSWMGNTISAPTNGKMRASIVNNRTLVGGQMDNRILIGPPSSASPA